VLILQLIRKHYQLYFLL